jgi:hypothetical protein
VKQLKEISCTIDNNKKDDSNGKRSKGKKTNHHGKKGGQKGSSGSDPKFYCTEHGNNPLHDTPDCWTLKNRANKANVEQKQAKKKQFSNKQFRKEINLLVKYS